MRSHPSTLIFEGHLTQEKLETYFKSIDFVFWNSTEKQTILIDARSMTGYDTEARDWYQNTWSQKRGAQVSKMAVVTAKPLWRLVVATLNLVTSFPLKAFNTMNEAREWLED